MDKIRSKKNILVGFLPVALTTILMHLVLKDITFISGLLWGFTLSYCGLLLFIFIPNFKSGQDIEKLSIVNYLLRSTIRMSTILVLFVALVFILKVHALGLLAGAFAGMMILSFLFLFKMKPAQ